MALDFQQVHQQVKQLGEQAPQREQRLQDLRVEAHDLLEHHSDRVKELRVKVELAATQVPTLRCARPESEPLSGTYPLPTLQEGILVISADGSQIAPNRHEGVAYYLINVGAIQLRMGTSFPPEVSVESKLYYGDALFTSSGMVSEGFVTLKRDIRERAYLAELTANLAAKGQLSDLVITLTDGPLELWGPKERIGGGESQFRQSLEAYKRALSQLLELGVSTAGYVDKPRADLIIRLLEVVSLDENRLDQAGRERRFQGVTDVDLYRDRLAPGERSSVFGLQSQSVSDYTGALSLHFFYLNVGREGKPWLARVEIPACVAEDQAKLDALHAVLIQQCRVLGNRSFPYLLHRAHEAAVVTRDEKEQLTQMIAQELRRKNLPVEEPSQKQNVKDLPGRMRYKG